MTKRNAYEKASRCMFWGLFLKLFTLDIWYFPTIQQVVSLVLFFQGLSILRGQNLYYRKAWIAACCRLCLGIFTLCLSSFMPEMPGLVLTLVDFTIFLLQLCWYCTGSREFGISITGEVIPQCDRIKIEYAVASIGMCFMMFIPLLNIFTFIVYPVLLIVIMVQTFRIHDSIKAIVQGPMEHAAFLPTSAAIVMFGGLTFAIMSGVSFYLERQETISYLPWEISENNAARAALVDKGLPQKIAEDLDDETVASMQDVLYLFQDSRYIAEHSTLYLYYGISEDAKVHFLSWYEVTEKDLPNKCTNGQRFTYGDGTNHRWQEIKTKIVALYDQNGITYGHTDEKPFDFLLEKGEQRRGYSYTALPQITSAGERPIFTVIALSEFAYDKSWFQYPYQLDSLYADYEDRYVNGNDLKNDNRKFNRTRLSVEYDTQYLLHKTRSMISE